MSINNNSQPYMASSLPVTSHALKRQSKRLKCGLESLLSSPPEKVTLSFAQEFLARHVWGQLSWDSMKPSSHLSSPIPNAKHERSSNLLAWLGVPRAQALIRILMDVQGETMWVERAKHLSDALFSIEEARLKYLSDDVKFLNSYKDRFEQKNGMSPSLGSESFCAASLRFMLDLKNAEWIFRSLKERTAAFGVTDCYAILKFQQMLEDIPGYDKNRWLEEKNQTEDAVLQYGYLASQIARALDLVEQIVRENPIFWSGEHAQAISSIVNWPYVDETWLAMLSESNTDFEIVKLKQHAEVLGGTVDAVAALERISLGGHSTYSKYLLKWLRQTSLTKHMSDQLLIQIRKSRAKIDG